MDRVITYAIKVAALFYGVFTGFFGLFLWDMIEEHNGKKREYLKWKRKRSIDEVMGKTGK